MSVTLGLKSCNIGTYALVKHNLTKLAYSLKYATYCTLLTTHSDLTGLAEDIHVLARDGDSAQACRQCAVCCG